MCQEDFFFLIVWAVVTLIAYCFVSCVLSTCRCCILGIITLPQKQASPECQTPSPTVLPIKYIQTTPSHTHPSPTEMFNLPPCTLQFDLCEYMYIVTDLYLAHTALIHSRWICAVFTLNSYFYLILKKDFHCNVKYSGWFSQIKSYFWLKWSQLL